jgi:predicted branched-subunit amino acid permease
MKNTLLHAETIASLAAVAVVVHLVASVDWPWAIAIGAAAAVLVRALLHRRAPRTARH